MTVYASQFDLKHVKVAGRSADRETSQADSEFDADEADEVAEFVKVIGRVQISPFLKSGWVIGHRDR